MSEDSDTVGWVSEQYTLWEEGLAGHIEAAGECLPVSKYPPTNR